MTDERDHSAAGDRFATTAEQYATHRPGYTARVFEYLDTRFGLTESDRVLDLACGTGEIKLPLAERVGEVVTMDPNSEMLARVERNANEGAIDNVVARQGSDADLPAVDGPFELVGMGRSFHWIDQKRTVREI
jgi:ubiquinone/menaquinone biosynthesis C-methylase UbiE